MRLVAMLLTMLTAVLSTVTGARAETFLLKGGGRIYGVAEKKGAADWITVRTSYGRVRFKKSQLKKKLTKGRERDTLYVEEARVTNLEGKVWTSDDGGDSWRRIVWKTKKHTRAGKQEFPPRVRAGELVKTGPDSLVDLDVGWGVVLLDQKTVLQLQMYQGATLRLDKGRMAARLEKLPKERRFRVETSQASMGVVGTTFVVEAGEVTRLAVLEGKVEVGDKFVTAGQVVVIGPDGTSAPGPLTKADRTLGEEARKSIAYPRIDWVHVPVGSFMMGGEQRKEENLRESNNSLQNVPRHRVSVRGFLLGRTEVTQGQYKVFTDWVAKHGDQDLWRGDRPEKVSYCSRVFGWEDKSWADRDVCVYGKSWYAATAFSRWIGDRLPTEAEWEYACRAGNSEIYPLGKNPSDLNDYAWTVYNSGKKVFRAFDAGMIGFEEGEELRRLRDAFVRENACRPHRVGLKRPNAFGLFDMYGNVWEWVVDTASPDYVGAPTDGSAWVREEIGDRVTRGGAFDKWGAGADASPRLGFAPELKASGFRVARDLPR